MLRRCATIRFGGSFALPAVQSTFDLTHSVTNQSVPLENFCVYKSCRLFQESLDVHYKSGGGEAAAAKKQGFTDRCLAYGKICGSKEMLDAAFLANKHTPVFSAFDRFGNRFPGRADFHPSYHQLMTVAIEHRVPSLAWAGGTQHQQGDEQPFLPRGILSMMHYQMEQGTSCPLTMTCAGVAPLMRARSAAQKSGETQMAAELQMWIEKLTSDKYDSRDVHISEKTGATIGMSMTEKQGGSDVRANTTVATPVSGTSSGSGGDAAFYTLRGHKWFTSAPMCDCFLTLAQVEGAGLSCFLVPRWVAAGQPNAGLQFQRLKDKLGDKSNASSEVEYHDALALRVGPVGSGVKTIIEMVNLTRLDCLIGSAALMHRACLEAAHHAVNRSAFGGLLAEKPLMQNVLCDMALESEAACALALRMCRAFQRGNDEAVFARIGVAISKYFVCKRVPALAYEAMECLGGNGYTEDFPLARIYRQAPLNAIWEGSGNVAVLDMFRAASKQPETVAALQGELLGKLSKDVRLTSALKEVSAAMKNVAEIEIHGRRIVERLARLMQAAALKEYGNEFIYDAFVESRIVHSSATSSLDLFGTLDKKFVSKELVNRITPHYL